VSSKIVNQFIKKFSLKKGQIDELDNDASARIYFRTNNKIIAYIPKEKGESIDNFINATKILSNIDIKVPNIHIQDKKLEILLIDDFGNNKISKIINQSNTKEILKKCIDVIIKIQSYKHKNDVSTFDLKAIIEETLMFIDWYLIKEKNINVSHNDRDYFIKIITSLYHKAEIKNSVYIHKDYHVDNIFYFPMEEKEIGIIDYQDLNIGHASYDIMSILKDTRNPIDKILEKQLLNYYINKTKFNKDEIIRGYDFFSIQRNLKIIGIFSRLKHRDNKIKYMDLIRNCKEFISRTLQNSEYSDLNSWILKKDKYFSN
tara:strand:- start:12525 stop:13472 length:948 start_codon:yes stop_codon:yes gene_type:complete